MNILENANNYMDEEEQGEVYYYFINRDERGEFYADVRDSEDNTVFELKTSDDPNEGDEDFLANVGMKHTKDIEGLEDHLKEIGTIPKDASLEAGQY